MAYVICEPCITVKDKACVEICPVDCIYEGPKDGFPDMLFIHPDECIDCGVCQPECPVSAIFPEDDVPDEWNHFTELNKTVHDRSFDTPKDGIYAPYWADPQHKVAA